MARMKNSFDPTPDSITWLIDWHLHRRPLMEAQDVYKLLYQGVFGPEHIIQSPAAFAGRLHQEIEGLGALHLDPLQPVWEPVRADQSLVRLNLRPFLVRSGDIAHLISMCIQTGRQTWGTATELRQAWESFVDLWKEGRWPGFTPNVSEYSRRLERDRLPAVHHSSIYRTAYRPAYRLVAQEYLQDLPPEA
jgi:hypothetical protein